MGYKVLSDEFTVHRDLRELKDKDGNVTGRQLGLGKVYVRDEVIPDNHVGQVYKDALEDEDNEAHEWVSENLEQVGDDPSQNLAQRLGVPFEEYEGMDEEDIVAAMRHLPSGMIQRIKQYENSLDEPRDKIIHYNIGYGSDPDARAEGRTMAASEENEDREVAEEDKPTAKLTTREVSEEGEVTHGEGYTGTGEGIRPYGSEKEGEDGGDGGKKKVTRNRRGRRDRSASEDKPSETSSGG
jgi:hypothetical protein